MTLQIPRLVQHFGKHFREAGFNAYLVGGAVRNIIQGKAPADYDIATNAHPSDVQKIFKIVIPTGIKHGTVTVIFKSMHFEVTTFRTEAGYSDLRRPDSVEFVGDLYTDLERRDFTINAIAVDLTNSKVIDPHEGRKDLQNRNVKAIGVPQERFSEDGLRLMRGCRFACQLDFAVEQTTLEAMRECRENLRGVSPERIRDEINKMLASALPSVGFLLMEQTGLLKDVLPELARCRGITQKGDHLFDVLDHCLYSCDGAPSDNLEVRLAALFHDIGKTDAKKVLNGTVVFHEHEGVSAEMATKVLRRLKYPKIVEKNVAHLIKHHMFAYEPDWSDSAVRRFVRRVGLEQLPDLFALRIADGYGVKRKNPSGFGVKELSKRVEQVLEQSAALSIGDLAINGNDLAEEIDIPKGPDMGIVLNFLLESVTDDPTQNTRDTLLDLADKFYNERMKPLEDN